MSVNFDHTFAICAYKETEFLEQNIKSILRQTLRTKVIMVTSTPNDYIRRMSEKYNIPLFVRDGISDIRDDWNYAYDMADTEWVTISHQDDVYSRFYTEYVYKKIQQLPTAIAVTTDYLPIKGGKTGKRDINSVIRRMLRRPLKNDRLAAKKIWKKRILSLGNSICCPSVTYNKKLLGAAFFTSDLKFNIDWDTFLKMAYIEGPFAYVDKPLTYYRIHSGATSKEFIENKGRETEDRYMFSKFWPGWFVNVIMIFYKFAYKTYG